MDNEQGLFLGSMSRLSNARTRSISAENFTGEPGGGAKATVGSSAARDLGRGWKVSPSVRIEPHTVFTMADVEGPGVIRSMWCTGSASDCILRIYWDDQEQPSVEAPLGAFFGYPINVNTDDSTGSFPFLNSAAVMVAPNRGLSCYWEMPFRSRCRMTLENRDAGERILYYQINYELGEVPEDCAYFHAQYRIAHPLQAGDVYTVLDGVKGRGQYVGTSLLVSLNGNGRWWGEGEIKFYMDGDSEFPTVCGTGTEDYFCGAYNWDVNGRYTTYSGLYAGMYCLVNPDGLYVSQQKFMMYRWHLPDPIRFTEDLRVTLQDLGWRSDGTYLTRRDDFTSVAYWYQTLPTAPFPVLPAHDALVI